MKIKLLLLTLACNAPLVARKLDDAIASTEQAQANLPKLLAAGILLKKASSKTDEVKVALTGPKQTIAAQQAELEHAKQQLEEVRAQIAAQPKIPPSISQPLGRSLDKQEELLNKLAAMLRRAQNSVDVVEQQLPTLKTQTMQLAGDIKALHTHGGAVLEKTHARLVGLRDRRNKLGSLVGRSS